MTALMLASSRGHIAVVQLLLKVPGLDLNLGNEVNPLFCYHVQYTLANEYV